MACIEPQHGKKRLGGLVVSWRRASSFDEDLGSEIQSCWHGGNGNGGANRNIGTVDKNGWPRDGRVEMQRTSGRDSWGVWFREKGNGNSSVNEGRKSSCHWWERSCDPGLAGHRDRGRSCREKGDGGNRRMAGSGEEWSFEGITWCAMSLVFRSDEMCYCIVRTWSKWDKIIFLLKLIDLNGASNAWRLQYNFKKFYQYSVKKVKYLAYKNNC